MGARRVVASAERQEQPDTAFELRTIEQVTAALDKMKIAPMKLGQVASCLDQGLPEHVCHALSPLQSSAPPVSAELAAGVIQANLGHQPDPVCQRVRRPSLHPRAAGAGPPVNGDPHAGNWRRLAEGLRPFVAAAPSTSMAEHVARGEAQRA